jgi:hypothetical protein
MTKLLSIFAIGFLLVTGQNVLAADSATPEIWMFAGPRVANVASGWEGLRTDAGDMWKPDAPWDTVAHAVKVIQFAPTNVDRARDSDLQQALADIKRRNIALAVGDGLLIRSDRCRSKTEAYGEPGALERMFDKLRRNGADVKYVTMDEPFFYGHRDSGPTSCHESAQALAQALKESIAIVRKYFPNAQFGADEVVDASRLWVDELAAWTDTFKAVTGEPLAYLHADLNWTEGAVHNLVPLAAALKQRHVRLGVIYDADRSGKSDESWTRNAVSNFARVESGVGVHPDHAVIETWVRYPTRMLPENEPGTFTNVVLQYIQKHPQ